MKNLAGWRLLLAQALQTVPFVSSADVYHAKRFVATREDMSMAAETTNHGATQEGGVILLVMVHIPLVRSLAHSSADVI